MITLGKVLYLVYNNVLLFLRAIRISKPHHLSVDVKHRCI